MSMPELPPDLQLALGACEVTAPTTPTGEVCFHAIPKEYKDEGVTRHHLAMLAELGYLTQTGDMSCSLGNATYRLTLHAKLTELTKLKKMIEAKMQRDAAPTDDAPESKWQEVTWSDIGKRLLLKGAVVVGTTLAKAILEEVFSPTYEDANGRKHDKKTGRFTK